MSWQVVLLLNWFIQRGYFMLKKYFSMALCFAKLANHARIQMRAKRLRSLALAMFALGLFYYPVTASAFRVGTHVWVAQQVLNDLQDGVLTIPIGGVNHDVAIDPAIVSAIINHPAEYRMGNIGPDAFPDILTGQSVVHPGVPGAWKTDDWMRFLLTQAQTPDQKAFVYGYLGHASADVFAHTYINQYTGDIWDLTDGEIDVEKRHMALEKYIDSHTPALKDAAGNYLGQPYDLLATPSAFLRDKLILDDTTAAQNSNGGMLHLSAVHDLRKALDATHPMMSEIEALIAREVVAAATGVRLNTQQSAALYNLVNNLNNAINSKAVDQIQAAVNDLNAGLQQVAGINAAIQSRLISAAADVWNAKSQVDQAALNLANETLKLANTATQICTTVISTVNCGSCSSCLKKVFGVCIAPNPLYPICESNRIACEITKAAGTLVCNANPIYVTLQASVAALQATKNATDLVFASSLDALRAANTAAYDSSIALLQAQNAVFNGLIDTYQRLTADLNPVRAYIDGWILDIDNGMGAYVNASGELIRQTMIPGGAPLKPLLDWVDCWGLSLTGILPGPANNALCAANNSLSNLMAALTKFETTMGNLNPIVAAFNRLKDQIVARANVVASDLAYQVANKVTGIDVQQLIGLYTMPVDSAILNSIFAVDNSTKGLLLIGDIASRVDAEMYMIPQAAVGPFPLTMTFDPQRYAVVYNAVLQAKLALLSTDQLNQLAFTAGVPGSTVYPAGTPLYDNTGVGPNLLIDSIASIDGNHQWRDEHPPYPRRVGAPFDPLNVAPYAEKRTYSYTSANGKGYRLWQDPVARDNLFRKLFLGPLVPGLETPEDMGFFPVIPKDYPYVVCKANPYPFLLNDLISCPIVPPAVDLVMTAVRASASVILVGTTATVHLTVKNQGTTPTEVPSVVGIYLSKNLTINSLDTLIGSWTAPFLAPGASASADIVVTVPANLARGQYYLGVIADSTNLQPETIETNNALTGARLRIR